MSEKNQGQFLIINYFQNIFRSIFSMVSQLQKSKKSINRHFDQREKSIDINTS